MKRVFKLNDFGFELIRVIDIVDGEERELALEANCEGVLDGHY
jgi:hypothetical protein